jgi:hypothetical protein
MADSCGFAVHDPAYGFVGEAVGSLQTEVNKRAGIFDRPGFNLYVTVLEPYLSASF